MNRNNSVPRVSVKTPKFRTEAEEAAWWDAHPEIILKAVERAYGKKAVERVLGGEGQAQTPIYKNGHDSSAGRRCGASPALGRPERFEISDTCQDTAA